MKVDAIKINSDKTWTHLESLPFFEGCLNYFDDLTKHNFEVILPSLQRVCVGGGGKEEYQIGIIIMKNVANQNVTIKSNSKMN